MVEGKKEKEPPKKKKTNYIEFGGVYAEEGGA